MCTTDEAAGQGHLGPMAEHGVRTVMHIRADLRERVSGTKAKMLHQH